MSPDREGPRDQDCSDIGFEYSVERFQQLQSTDQQDGQPLTHAVQGKQGQSERLQHAEGLDAIQTERSQQLFQININEAASAIEPQDSPQGKQNT